MSRLKHQFDTTFHCLSQWFYVTRTLTGVNGWVQVVIEHMMGQLEHWAELYSPNLTLNWHWDLWTMPILRLGSGPYHLTLFRRWESRGRFSCDEIERYIGDKHMTTSGIRGWVAWGIGRGVKLLVLRAEGRRFESGGRFFGGFGLVFEVIVGWCPTRSDLRGLSQSFGGHVSSIFLTFGTPFNYLSESF